MNWRSICCTYKKMNSRLKPKKNKAKAERRQKEGQNEMKDYYC